MDGFWPTFTRRKFQPADYAQELAIVHSQTMENPDKVILFLQDFCKDFCIKSYDNYNEMVKKGDKVKAGQKVGIIGNSDNYLAVHSSISGAVADIDDLNHPLGWKARAVVVKSDGLDEKVKSVPFSDSGYENTRAGHIAFMREMGIPIDYAMPQNVSNVLINCTEFEPCLSSKARIIQEEAQKITGGLKALLNIYTSNRVLFLIEKKQRYLYNNLKKTCSQIGKAQAVIVSKPIPDTIQALLRQRMFFESIHARKHKDSARAMMIEPAVLVAIHDAYNEGVPFIRQLVSVVGSGVKRPGNLWLRCATALDYIIKERGGNLSTIGRVTYGGPLMGIPQHDLTVPIIKRLHGISIDAAVFFDEERKSRFYKTSACIRCAKCADVCPANLQPNLIVEFIKERRYEEAIETGLFSCLECGLCYYVCPAYIPLMELLELGKYRSVGKETLLSFNYYRTFYN
ncbi:RnfABCDGE type electron transport complex subunit C [Candidatus Magnetoovum chiemensis]|nr:RnfABCDGE type electron transport complex subunit C [Candidatus Magnetoovum chiemensis]